MKFFGIKCKCGGYVRYKSNGRCVACIRAKNARYTAVADDARRKIENAKILKELGLVCPFRFE